MAAAVSRDDELVIKSPNDKRSYRLLRLGNGLRALLVHDPEIYADGYPPQTSKPCEDEEMEEVDEEDEDVDDDSEEYSDEEGEDDDEEDGEDDEEEDEGEPKRRNEKVGAEPIVKKVAMVFSC